MTPQEFLLDRLVRAGGTLTVETKDARTVRAAYRLAARGFVAVEKRDAGLQVTDMRRGAPARTL